MFQLKKTLLAHKGRDKKGFALRESDGAACCERVSGVHIMGGRRRSVLRIRDAAGSGVVMLQAVSQPFPGASL